MNIAKARALAQQDRQLIGRLLGLAREGKRVGEDLGKTQSDLHRLYREYPCIKPIRTKQLSLFK